MTEYQVRMLHSISARNPVEAVHGYIREATLLGLDFFNYRVEDPETDEVWFVNVSTTPPKVMTDVEFMAPYIPAEVVEETKRYLGRRPLS